MVMLPQIVNATEIATKPMSKKFHVPDGDYMTVLLSDEWRDSRFQGKPQEIVIHGVIVDGPERDKDFYIYCPILDDTPMNATKNPTWTYSKMGYGLLGQIALAFGITGDIGDTSKFLNRKLITKFKTREGKDKTTGERKPEWDESDIECFKPAPQVGFAGKPAFAATTAPAAQAGGVQSAPWKK